MGWDDEIINSEGVDSRFKCPVCLDVLKDAVQCDNQHAFCATCTGQSCPLCRCSTARAVPFRLLRELIGDFEGHCQHCQKTFTLNKIDTHQNNCDQKLYTCRCQEQIRLGLRCLHDTVCQDIMVKCPNEGCEEYFKRRDMSSHREHCQHEVVKCTHVSCMKKMKRKAVVGHRLLKCPEEPMKCERGCNETFLRRCYDAHRSTCTHVPIECTASRCTFQVLKKDLQDHQDVCQFVIVKCDKCHAEKARSQLRSHEDECLEEFVKCPHDCGTNILRKNVSRHAKKCVQAPWTCPDCGLEESNQTKDYHDCLRSMGRLVTEQKLKMDQMNEVLLIY